MNMAHGEPLAPGVIGHKKHEESQEEMLVSAGLAFLVCGVYTLRESGHAIKVGN